ncbi:MAG TPA: VOC family protein, partial [Saprospiraceae bacterium]|nr:VOC family protein [Saprospiraceae bacterium]
MAKKQKITPFLWYDHQAEEAAGFYTSVFKKSKILEVVRHTGGVQIVRFSLMGYEINALNGGPAFRFN